MTGTEVAALVETATGAARAAGSEWRAWLPTLVADFVVNARVGRDAAGGAAVETWPPLAADAHRHDLDDVHFASLTHPGSVIWPAVLPVAARHGQTVAELADAAALGYEITARLGRALLPVRSTIHTTGTAGAAGAAAAAASAAGLDRPATEDAVSHAVSFSGGLAQCLVEASGTRAFHRAAAAATGVLAATLAAGGLRATRHVLEGPGGLWALVPDADVDALHAAWGPAVAETRVRTEPVSGFFQAAVLAARSVPQGEEVVAVRVGDAVARFSATRADGDDLVGVLHGLLGASVAADATVEVSSGLEVPAAEVVTRRGARVTAELPSAGRPGCRGQVADKARNAGLDAELVLWEQAVASPGVTVREVLASSAVPVTQIGAP